MTRSPETESGAAPVQHGLGLRAYAPEPPRGATRLRWWSPGLLWAMSAVGSGSVLFTPRVGSEYRYELLWLLWLVALLMWVMIREAGRFAVVTGRTLLDGYSTLPGPRTGRCGWCSSHSWWPHSPGSAGIVPGVPDQLDVPFVLPWIGTILAGSMGIIWFSYWTAARGFGGGTAEESEPPPGSDELSPQVVERRVAAWLRTMSATATVGVVTGTVVITAFLVLGAELLAPEGIMPSGTDVAEQLTRLLSDVWGQVGHWLMVAAIVTALGGSVLANQDGWSRSFADIVLLLRRGRGGDPASERPLQDSPWLSRLLAWRPSGMRPRRALTLLFAAVVTGLLPAVIVVLVRDPVVIMSASGVVATIHTPFIVLATLAVNRRIPAGLRPGLVASSALALAGLFYTGFAVLYFADMAGLLGG